MKKKLVALLLVVMLMISILPFAAFADECSHSNGYYAGACKDCGAVCDHSSGYSGGKINTPGKCNTCKMNCTHPASEISYVITNCQNANGQKYGKEVCTCGYYQQKSLGAAVDHVYSGDICVNCGQTHSHTFGTDGICTTAGCNETHTSHTFNTQGKCTTVGCNAVCEHDYQPNVKECGTAGAYNNEVCSICKNATVGTATPATHNYVDGVCTVCKKTEPTCNHKWGDDGACVNGCGETCPHEESELDYRDCVDSQYDHEVCKACGVITNATVAKERTTHTYENGVCTFCGKAEPEKECEHDWNGLDGTCNECGVEHDHDYEDVMPNCTYGGYHNQYCAGCKHTIIGEAVDSKNHVFGDDGVCTVCGTEKTDCDHEWNWATAQCKLCGEYHIHSEDDLYIDHPDCTEGGYVREICEVCGHILVKSGFEPMDHDYNNGVCTRCGHVKPVENTKRASTEGLDDVPATGDNRFTVLTVAAVVVLFGATAILFTKKRIAR